jgi:uncharacterized protein YukJ
LKLLTSAKERRGNEGKSQNFDKLANNDDVKKFNIIYNEISNDEKDNILLSNFKSDSLMNNNPLDPLVFDTEKYDYDYPQSPLTNTDSNPSSPVFRDSINQKNRIEAKISPRLV